MPTLLPSTTKLFLLLPLHKHDRSFVERWVHELAYDSEAADGFIVSIPRVRRHWDTAVVSLYWPILLATLLCYVGLIQAVSVVNLQIGLGVEGN